MKVAIFGCLHGMLDEMYNNVISYERNRSTKIDFIIVCGDCQTIRHKDDLQCLAVPPRYKNLGDFHEYYSGKKKIPKLTIFVGGNHEASNYLMSLPYGGWVCDNFYYLGYAGVVRYKNLRIAGVSGIYNFHSCNKGRFEKMPLNDQTLRSVYHTRRLDIFRLQLLSKGIEEKDPLDVFISHDWPTRIYEHGNMAQLLRFKPDFRRDVESKNGLGSPLTEPLVSQLKPRRWFAAHLHCKFYAKVNHDEAQGRCTEFLSLNKIENRRHFMEVLELDNSKDYNDSDNDLYYDLEWLTILRKTVNLESDSPNNVNCPRIEDDTGKDYFALDNELDETLRMMEESGGMKIKRNFRMIEPVIYDRPHGLPPSLDSMRQRFYPNYQTEELCSRLKLGLEQPKKEKTENGTPSTNIDCKKGIKVESDVEESKPNPQLFKPIKIEYSPTLKSEGESSHPPTKRRAVIKQESPVELDEDGCLPFYLDTKGER